MSLSITRNKTESDGDSDGEDTALMPK